MDAPRAPISAKLRTQALGMLTMLGLQFLLGIITNLYVKIPDSHPGTNAADYFSGLLQGISWSFSSGFVSLVLHAFIGIALFIGSATMLIRAVKAKHRQWIIVTSLGFAGILIAFLNGVSFVNYAQQYSSLIMAIGFLISMTAYIFALLI